MRFYAKFYTLKKIVCSRDDFNGLNTFWGKRVIVVDFSPRIRPTKEFENYKFGKRWIPTSVIVSLIVFVCDVYVLIEMAA